MVVSSCSGGGAIPIDGTLGWLGGGGLLSLAGLGWDRVVGGGVQRWYWVVVVVVVLGEGGGVIQRVCGVVVTVDDFVSQGGDWAVGWGMGGDGEDGDPTLRGGGVVSWVGFGCCPRPQSMSSRGYLSVVFCLFFLPEDGVY